MKILLSPQMRENEKIIYEFEEGIVRATYKGKTDVFDFRDFSEGELDPILFFGLSYRLIV